MLIERRLRREVGWRRVRPSRRCVGLSIPLALLAALLTIGMPAMSFAQPTNPPDRDGLLKGLGMGLASIAEMNNFPGPKHILDAKDDLLLTRDQVKKIEALDKLVASAAIQKGTDVVQAEDELEKLFENPSVSEKTVRSKLEEIGKLRADLRFIHLQAHLRMKQILTPEQIKKYAEIKGRESKSEN